MSKATHEAAAKSIGAAGDDREFVRSLAKGLAVIEAFDAASPTMTLSEIARRTKLTPGSARRMLVTLHRLGYVGAEGQNFRLLPRALRLGYAYLSSLGLASLVQPRLIALTQELDECCSLAILDGLEVVYVARVPSKRLTRDYMAVGSRFPAHLTSVGKVMLAGASPPVFADYLARAQFQAITPFSLKDSASLVATARVVQRQSWAINDQETVLGLRSVAVPILVDGQVIAALGASTEVVRTTVEQMTERFVPALQRASSFVSDLLSQVEPRRRWE